MSKRQPIIVPASQIAEGSTHHQIPVYGEIITYRCGVEVRSCKNTCLHSGGKFKLQEGSSIAKCERHGWELDLKTMSYLKPNGDLKQPEIEVGLQDTICVFGDQVVPGINYEPQPKRKLNQNEFKFEFWTHACGVITIGEKTIVTDPWLIGPAFIRGWWLRHKPPKNWLQRLISTDYIYISHHHSDHLNHHTLKVLRDAISETDTREPTFLIPDFKSKSVEQPLRSLGFNNFLIQPFLKWNDLSPNSRFMLLPDGSERRDSALLVDFKGHLLLNTVDCPNPASLELPKEVDVWLGSFAGGATDHPICWTEQYGRSKVRKMLKGYKKIGEQGIQRIATACKPKIAVPFAGYFDVAHPYDVDIRQLLQRRGWREFKRAVKRSSPDSKVWLPSPGAELDLSSELKQKLFSINHLRDNSSDIYDFKKFTDIVDNLANQFPNSDDAVTHYFRWAGFKDSLSLNLVEVDERFENIVSNRFIDLQTQAVVTQKPEREKSLSIKVRWSVLRWLFVTGASWEEMLIGYQARFFRETDSYELEFWEHFMYNLPPAPPDYSGFLSPSAQ